MSEPPAKQSSSSSITGPEVRALERKIKTHIARRSTLFLRVQQAFDLINNVSDPKVLSQFRVRCRDLAETRNEFSMLIDEINETELILNPKKEIDSQSFSAFDDLYYQCLSILDSLVESSDPAGSRNPSNYCSDIVKLPKIPLRRFDGNLHDFIPWYNLFSSVINKSNMADVQKLLYLLSSLEGEPLNLIKHLPTTAANYKVAINLLLNRYNSKRKLASSYVEKLLTMEALKNDSYNKLRTFHENLTEQYLALEALEIPDLSDFILFQMTFRKVDPSNRKAFESHLKKDRSTDCNTPPPLPTFRQLLEFLGDQCQILESANLSPAQSTSQRSSSNYQRSSDVRSQSDCGAPSFRRTEHKPKPYISKGVFVATTTSSKRNKGEASMCCPCCQGSHTLYVCPQFRSISVTQRKTKVEALGRCINCLGNHDISKCGSKSKCLKCNGVHHHTLLCINDGPSSSPSGNTHVPDGLSTPTEPNIFSSVAQSPEPTVLLGTAVIHIQDISGAFIESRVLVDSGSQSSFVSKSFFNKLGLPYRKSDIALNGLGQTTVTQQKGIGSIVIKPRISSSPLLSTQVVILENLSGYLPACKLPDGVYDKFKHLPLADPHFAEPAPLDGIIGAELFPLICIGYPQPSDPGLPSAFPSLFGWIIMGPVTPSLRISAFIAEVSLETSLKRFWEIEEPPSLKIVDPETDVCEVIFKRYTREADGRYVVPLLLKENSHELGGSFAYALRCLLSTERRLAKHPDLKDVYHRFMCDYENTGHMRKLNTQPLFSSFFIPHHVIFNPSSPTTKTRVVFNGSAPSESGLSLNDILYTGPKLQQDMIDIIMKFRFHIVAFTADICKMYRQIKILPDETKFQRILWRYSPQDPVSVYELNVVTWGLRSSSYLACRTILQLAIDEAKSLPRVFDVITNETYIDDVITGAPSVNEALQLQCNLIKVFSKGGFELRKWSSNCSALLSSLPSEHVQTPLMFDTLEDNCRIKVLGLQWNPVNDEFTYHLAPLEMRTTKREILSDISKLYDPMGWLSPVILVAKSLIQQLWLLGCGWDDPIPTNIYNLWESFVLNFPSLSHVRIPRLILGLNKAEYHLIGFSDASESGYASVLYLHVINSNDSSSTHLVLAKSRVSPLKPLSIPRLELCGALLLSKLFKVCLPLFSSRVNISSLLAFTDSSVVLAWIRTSPHLLKQFIANRVVEITSVIGPSQWHHVMSRDNPADCASRGLMPQCITSHPLWFSGPPWLSCCKSDWPIFNEPPSLTDIPELRSTKAIFVAVKQADQENYLLLRYSSFQKTLRITAWILRAINNFKKSSFPRLVGPLSSVELKRSLHRLVKIVQADHFSKDISLLLKGKDCSSRIRSLSPFLDVDGLLRVGGRLRFADISDNAKYPLILPKNSLFTRMLIDYYHIINLHIGPRALQCCLQRQFWIISARQAIRSRLVKCMPCFKMRTQVIQPRMGDLPLSRVQQARPFQVVGTDFGGPFIIKENSRRNAKTSKAYLCLIICFSTKAVHLEVVSDLSSEAFLAAFDRFVSRRGKCSTVYSDCGTNFVGANRYLFEFQQLLQHPHHHDAIHNHLANQSISWCFGPPYAPHFGGIWEAGIKSAKHLLRRIIGDRPLTFEQLATVFTKVEAILNSRPLCPLNTDPSELEALTPGHFLIGCPLTALPEYNLTEVPFNRLSQWQLLRQLSQTFWVRWRDEYLSTLTQRQKWTTSAPNLKEGDLVLLRDNKTPPLCWRLGRIEKVHPGEDGIVRVVTLRTAQGSLRRPVVRLSPLPLS